MLASIQLKKYYLSDIEFNYSPDSNQIENKRVKFKHNIDYLESNLVVVTINCLIEDESGLRLKVSLRGLFEVESSTNLEEDTETQELCEKNTLAILFPYLRSSVSDISLKANIDPIILPTINIVALVEDSKDKMKNAE